MQCTGQPIPKGYEVHHRNEDPLDNSFDNLICLHPLDHSKLHHQTTDEDVPF